MLKWLKNLVNPNKRYNFAVFFKGTSSQIVSHLNPIIMAQVFSQSELVNALKGIGKGQFVGIVYMGDGNMNKGRGANANPLYGKVVEIKAVVWQFGYDYEAAVKAHIAKAGGEPSEFEAASLPWGEWVGEGLISHKGEMYARFYEFGNSKYSNEYWVMDSESDSYHRATAEEIAVIKAYRKASSSSAKQSECGLSEKEQVKPRTIRLSNILSLKCGASEWSMAKAQAFAE